MAEAQAIAVTVHGRYLVEPSRGNATGLVVGFHGYGEAAEAQLDRLRSIPGANAWLLVSIQGLHRFYRSRDQQVIASWMTRQDRELAIADNLAYVAAVIDRVTRDQPPAAPLVIAGFSQGVAMAFRAACASRRPIAAVIAVAGDVPPELTPDQLQKLPAVLLTRGSRDEWYSAAKWDADRSRLRDARVPLRELAFEGGHEWNAEVSRAAGELLEKLGIKD